MDISQNIAYKPLKSVVLFPGFKNFESVCRLFVNFYYMWLSLNKTK